MADRNKRKGILVLKFGGTSVAGLERIRGCADIVKYYHRQGYGICVVVSAMAGETNRLVDLLYQAGDNNDSVHTHAEYDAVVASGENVSAGLFAYVLNQKGMKARSWQGFQLPILTDAHHGSAHIIDINVGALKKNIAMGEVAVITGFQGIDKHGRITTLGRGGSDTSAVAMAVALKAMRCDIYTDVNGVYSTDPRMVKGAQKLPMICYEEMLEMASLGSKVLHARSVELAMKHNLPLQVLSSFVEPNDKNNGTMIVAEKLLKQNMKKALESKLVTAVTVDNKEAKVIIYGVKDKPGVAALIFGLLGDANINVDMIIQSGSHRQDKKDHSDIAFTLQRQELKRGIVLLTKNKDAIDYDRISYDDKVVKISVIGLGMRSASGVAKTMFKALAEEKINIDAIATSEIKISVLVDEKDAIGAVKKLHHAFGL